MTRNHGIWLNNYLLHLFVLPIMYYPFLTEWYYSISGIRSQAAHGGPTQTYILRKGPCDKGTAL
jgi:hypothetical protein